MTFKMIFITVYLFIYSWLPTAAAAEDSKLTECEKKTPCTESFAAAQNAAKAGDSPRALQMFLTHLEKFNDQWALYPIAVMYQRLHDDRRAAEYFGRFLDAGLETDPARIEHVKSQRADALKRIDAQREEAPSVAVAHVSAPAPAPATAPARRPAWRAAVGASLLAGGTVAAGFGIAALAGPGKLCIVPDQLQGYRPEVGAACLDTVRFGSGMVVGGGLALAGGFLALFLPTWRKPQEKTQ